MKKILAILILNLMFLSFASFLPGRVFASGTLYFSPNSGTKYFGQNFTVSVRASGMDNVDGVSAVFTYPTDKLTFVSINGSGSAWSIKAQESNSNGTIQIDRGNIGNLSGDKLVASVTFKPKTNKGSATLAFTSTSALTLAGANVLSGRSSATFNLADAPAAPPPPVADKTAPNISGIKVTNLSVNSATITWTTNEASDSNVDYGTGKGYFLNANKGELVTNHSVELNKAFLEPGTNYHFIVRSKDSSGNEAKSTDQSLTTVGYQVGVKIVDEENNPLVKTKVILHPTQAQGVTDKKGNVTFQNVTVGEHALTILAGGQRLSGSILVKDVGAKEVKDKAGSPSFTTEIQNFTVKVLLNKNSLSTLQLAGVTLAGTGLIVLLAICIVLIIKSKRKKI